MVYVDDLGPGIRRRRAGSGFSYRGPDGETVRDPDTLGRIRRLAIPPAWEDVWICPDPRGHIQATGRDQKGRKQYRYHPDWSAARAETKYGRMAAFGQALPQVRERIDADLGRRGPVREKILATVVRLLELTLIRVGNREYARANRSYGLTTLEKRHLDVDGSALAFHFKGKSGVHHQTSVRDRRLARILRDLQHLPGQHLFKYRDEEGALVSVESADVNAYIREIAGEEFSAKDFRTWAGTVSAARALRLEPPPSTKTEAKHVVTRCVKAVSGVLGNTPAVCRSAYVHPAVLEAYVDGRLAEVLPDPEADEFEAELIKLLEADPSPLEGEGRSPRTGARRA
ncbi:DNA topoisomerase IB [Caulobacter sp. 17J80-11]|nr:DNA topoisomerase IB [Caulobacter sp. 17J80-11]MBC6983684.1 DNA topoisomerase IB [Caulobacter sp. 17J80-11]